MATILHADFVNWIPLLGYIAPICGGRPASRGTVGHCLTRFDTIRHDLTPFHSQGAALKALAEGGIVLVSPGGVKVPLSPFGAGTSRARRSVVVAVGDLWWWCSCS